MRAQDRLAPTLLSYLLYVGVFSVFNVNLSGTEDPEPRVLVLRTPEQKPEDKLKVESGSPWELAQAFCQDPFTTRGVSGGHEAVEIAQQKHDAHCQFVESHLFRSFIARIVRNADSDVLNYVEESFVPCDHPTSRNSHFPKEVPRGALAALFELPQLHGTASLLLLRRRRGGTLTAEDKRLFREQQQEINMRRLPRELPLVLKESPVPPSQWETILF
ncbi:unnamed protein product [Amoebophrya sp. A25]|nr:unnamed protein product [Amoebophrya sp. A25]|eukprot:GSA25T00014136001.1